MADNRRENWHDANHQRRSQYVSADQEAAGARARTERLNQFPRPTNFRAQISGRAHQGQGAEKGGKDHRLFHTLPKGRPGTQPSGEPESGQREQKTEDLKLTPDTQETQDDIDQENNSAGQDQLRVWPEYADNCRYPQRE